MPHRPTITAMPTPACHRATKLAEQLADLAKLPAFDRELLGIIALAEEHITRTTAYRALSAIGIGPRGERATTQNIKPSFDRLAGARLITGEQRWLVVEPIAEHLRREIRERGVFKQCAQAVIMACLPTYSRHAPSLNSLAYGRADWRRALRLALYTADEPGVRVLLRAPRYNYGYPPAAPFDIVHWVDRPLDTWVLSTLPGDLTSLFLLHIAGWRFDEAAPCDDLLGLAMTLTGEPEQASAARTVIDILASLDAAVPNEPSAKGVNPADELVLATASLQAGDINKAAIRFARAVPTNAEDELDGGLPPHPLALLAPFAFLLRNTKTYSNRGRRIARALQDLDKRSTRGHLGRALVRLADTLNGAPVAAAPTALHPLVTLIDGLADYWADRERDHGALTAAAAVANAAGMRWIGGELLALRDLDPKRAHNGVRPLFTLREPRSEWQLRLEQLEQVAGTATRATDGAVGANERIVWKLSYSAEHAWIDLEARAQKLAKGSWSRGRVVGRQRIAGAATAVPGMTEHDLRIAACVRKQADYWGGVEYDWPLEHTMRALVGHPLLVDPLDRPVTVTERRPTLSLRARGAQLNLSMDPPWTGDKVIVQSLSDRHHEVVVYDRIARAFAEKLGRGLRIPASEKDRMGSLLQQVGGSFAMADSAGAVQARDVPASGKPVVRLVPAGSGLRASVRVLPLGPGGPVLLLGRGAATIASEVAGEMLRTRRDLADEKRRLTELLSAVPLLTGDAQEDGAGSGDVLEFSDLADALELLTELEPVRASGDVDVLWPEGQNLRLRSPVRAAALSLRVGASQDWFAVSGAIELGGDDSSGLAGRTLEFAALLALLQGSPGRFIALGDGEYVALEDKLRRRLDAIARAGKQTDGAVKVHKLASGVIDGLFGGEAAIQAGVAWKRWQKTLASLPSVVPVPTTLSADLRPYQADGFVWLARLAALGAGACLADDMGLGKTVQVLALLLRRATDGPALVIAPTSVCGTWQEQAYRFTPTLRVHMFGTGDRAGQLAALGPSDVLVCSYGLLVSERDALCALDWHTAVLDESQAIKNPETHRHKAAVKLRAAMRICTTGTPVENHLGDLWAQFAFLNPGLLGSWRTFRARYAEPIEAGSRPVAASLRDLVRPYVLRRTKGEVLRELPPRTDITVSVELSPAEAALYEALRRKAVADIELGDQGAQPLAVLAALTRLRLACCHPRLALPDAKPSDLPESSKLAAFAEIQQELQEGGHRALVFSQFVRHLAIIREHLDGLGVPYLYLDGSTPARKRDKLVERFQAGEAALFLISLKAGGSGLNLTAADYVVHLDPWWNPAVEDQASDRAHRIGQRRPVTVYRLVAKGTIEEQIVGLHHQKRDLADRLLAGADTAARLSAGELLALMRGG